MKRLLALVTCLLLTFTLSACGGGNTTPTPAPTDTPSDAQPTEEPERTFPPIVVHSKDPNANEAPAPTATPVPTETPEPTEEPAPETPNPDGTVFQTAYDLDIEIPPLLQNGLELPVDGATGFASVNLPVWPDYPGDSTDSKLDTLLSSGISLASVPGIDAILVPGTGFQIIEEQGDWWRISYVDQTSPYGESLTVGWIEHRYCFINLPDVIPSILYNDTNCSGSIFVSCGKEIPNVTGYSFYNTSQYNVRLGRTEYIMPMLYTAARDVCAAQHKAMAEGNCLEIYQTFRPLDTQIKVAQAVDALAKVDPEVKAGISTAPWSISWFIATGSSNSQIGYGLDVSLVRMNAAERKTVKGTYNSYDYLRCTDFDRYVMPTAMHELSLAAASQVGPGNTTLSAGMKASECAQGLRRYFTTSGFTPLASAWWHFNSTAAEKATEACPSKGDYFTETCYSTLPN